MAPNADVSSLKAAGLALGGHLGRGSGSSTGGSVETLDSVQGKRGRTDVGRTDGRQRCCSNRGETCADQLDVHSGRGDRAFEGIMRAGEGEEPQGVGKMKNHRHLEEVGHGNPICGGTALITVGLPPPGAGAAGLERPALLATLSLLSRHWPSWGAALNVPTAVGVPPRLYGPRSRPSQGRAPSAWLEFGPGGTLSKPGVEEGHTWPVRACKYVPTVRPVQSGAGSEASREALWTGPACGL